MDLRLNPQVRETGIFDSPHYIFTYGRVSSIGQDALGNFASQRAILSSVIPKPDREFEDVMSGEETLRESYQAMISEVYAAIGSGYRVLVVIYDLSRFGRNDLEIRRIISEFDDLGVVLYSICEQVLTFKTPEQFLGASTQATIAHYFNQKLSSRLKDGKRVQRSLGRPCGGLAPIGYQYTKEKYIPDPERFQWVRENIFDAYLSGETLHQIEKKTKIKQSVLGYILRNPAYRGHLSYTPSGFSKKDFSKLKKLRGKGLPAKDPRRSLPKEMVFNTHDPMISEGEWRQIEGRLRDNKYYARRGSELPRYPLTGLVYCGHCDHNMVHIAPRQKYHYYQCRHPRCENPRKLIKMAEIESALLEEISGRGAEIAQAAIEPDDEPLNPEIAKLEQRLESVEALQVAHPSLFLSQEIESVRLQLKQARNGTYQQPSPPEDLQSLVTICSDPASYQALSMADKRILYHELVESIVVRILDTGERTIEVKLKF